MDGYFGSYDFRRLSVLTAYFIFLGIILYFLQLGQLSWYVLLVSAIGWFAIEMRANPKHLGNAIKLGLFLLVFDFIIENSGWIFGLWHTISQFHVGVVPIQVMLVALFGGAAWAMYMPKKFNLNHSMANCIVFALFGALGEWLLIRQGIFVYSLWWNSILAFFAYLITWIVLTFVRYRIFNK